MVIKTEEIIFKGTKARGFSNKSKTICDVFRYQPDNIEQMPLGNIYIVAELSYIKDCVHLNNLLASLIKREYYLHPHKGFFKSFQATLKKANNYLNDLAKEGKCEWLGRVHFICAAISGENLIIAQTGNSKAFFYRQNHFSDLGKRMVPESDKPHPSKIFSSVLSGNIMAGDKMILATPAVEQLFSANGLKQLFNSQPTITHVSDQINRVLREQEKTPPLAILIFQAEEDKIVDNANPLPTKSTTPPIDLNEILK